MRKNLASTSLVLGVCAFFCKNCESYQSPLNTGSTTASSFPPQVGGGKVIIEQKSWIYKERYNIGYEVAKHENYCDQLEEKEEPVLLLNGFGVGSFHQHRLIPNIFGDDNDDDSPNRVVYGVDYLGQGRSWPLNCDDGNSKNEEGLIYSADTWVDQIIQFIEHIILPNHTLSSSSSSSQTATTKIHLVGNSVGGYLSVALAQKRPDLIQSICLLNATPIWGLNLPGWSGELPPPFIPRKIGRFLFDSIRDLDTIETYLDTAYHHREAFDDTLMKQIRACTEGKGGHAAFASILWSPPVTFSEDPSNNDFGTNLQKVQCDALLIFGKEDTWCTPSVGKRMYNILSSRDNDNDNKPITRYVELENVSHCPNHEAPQAVGSIVKRWLNSKNNNKSIDHIALVEGKQQMFHEPWGTIVSRELDENEAKMSIKDQILSNMVI
jgi:pimeloyl-ACP methyl ester carboxylesterase